jgi:hypothetical protein
MKYFVLIIMMLALAFGNICLAQCGPGDHWVDTCPGGQDTLVNVLANGGIDFTLDCETDLYIPANGSAIINRANPSDDSQNYPGTRPVDGHLDVIDTEIISLTLGSSEVTILAGAGQGQGGVLPATYGVIAEQLSNPALAESFFDCYVEAYVFSQYVYNHVPIRLEATIDRYPPFGQTYTFNGCIAVYDSPDPGQGNLIGNITSIELTLQQEQTEIPTLSEWGMLIMALLLLAAGTVAVVRRRRKATVKI